MNLNLEANSNAKAIAAPRQGDIVHLKLVDSFEYLIKAIVTSTTAAQIEATIEAVFDWHGQGQIVSGDVTELVGTNVSFAPRFLHKVISHV